MWVLFWPLKRENFVVQLSYAKTWIADSTWDLRDKLQFINNVTVVTREPLIIFACAEHCSDRAHGKPPLDQFKLLVSSISKHISIAAAARGENARREHSESDTIGTTPFNAAAALFLSGETKTRSPRRLQIEFIRAIYQLFRFSFAAEHIHIYLGRIAARHK